MADEILTPVDLAGDLDQDDREILAADRETLETLVKAILENKRLAWLIVSAYCDLHEFRLLPWDKAGNHEKRS